jgi:hypothetical protein
MSKNDIQCSIGSKRCYKNNLCTCLSPENIDLLFFIYNKYRSREDNPSLKLLELKKQIYGTHDISDIDFLNHAIFRTDNRVNEIVEKRFLPVGPVDNSWLSNFNIDAIMKQYESYYYKFKYMGTQCIDFDLNDIVDEYISCKDFLSFGCIYNTDPCSKGGQHWIASFVDVEAQMIYYYDSYAYKPPRQIKKLLKTLAREMFSKSTGQCVQLNKVRHQYGNSECGVFCIDFIRNMLEKKTFKEFTRNNTDDRSKFLQRKTLFRKLSKN